MVDNDNDLRTRQVCYDIVTLFRVAPWIFVMGDKRAPKALVDAALADAKGFIEAHNADPTKDRRALMRGLLISWLNAMGVNPDPNGIEMIVSLIAQSVDAVVTSQFDDGLRGESA